MPIEARSRSLRQKEASLAMRVSLDAATTQRGQAVFGSPALSVGERRFDLN